MASKLGTEALKQFTKFLADGNGFDRVMKNVSFFLFYCVLCNNVECGLFIITLHYAIPTVDDCERWKR